MTICSSCGKNRRASMFISPVSGKPVKKYSDCRGGGGEATNVRGRKQREEEPEEYEAYSESQSSGDDSESDEIYCELCNKAFDIDAQAMKHVQSASHQKKVKNSNN